MAAEKQDPYPVGVGQPPAYPGQGTSTVGPPLQGFAPLPGQAPPPIAYPGSPPAGYPGSPPAGYPGSPPAVYPGSPSAGYPTTPTNPQPYVSGTYIAGQPVVSQPGVTIAQPAVVVASQPFRQSPVNTVCPHCSSNIITATSAEAGSLTWLICVVLCLTGFGLGCCLIPFCIPDCQDVKHSCPNCKKTIHVFHRM